MYNFLRPEYFDKFECIGSKCGENCCKDWVVYIDLDTYKNYLNLKESDFKRKLLENIIVTRDDKGNIENIKVKSINNKCYFLDSDGLCDIYKNLGKENMCYTCRVYPRSYSVVNGNIEGCLSPSCIEASKLILKDKNPMKFIASLKDDYIKYVRYDIESKNSNNPLEKYFNKLSLFSIKLMQNRNLSIEDRFITLGLFFDNLEKDITKDSIDKNIFDFEENINMYKNISKDINDGSYYQAYYLSSLLVDLINNKFLENQSYINFMTDIYNHFDFSHTSLDELDDKFNKSKSYYKSFIENKEHILENYVVNTMFLEKFPYSKNSPLSICIEFMLDFIVVKFITVCACGVYRENMNEDIFIKLIQSYYMAIKHEPNLSDRINNYLRENNIDNLASMFFMIKC